MEMLPWLVVSAFVGVVFGVLLSVILGLDHGTGVLVTWASACFGPLCIAMYRAYKYAKSNDS